MPELVKVVIVDVFSFTTPPSSVAVIVPELVKVVIVDEPSLSTVQSAAVIVPELVKVVFVALSNDTATLPDDTASIVTPELIVTLEPFPSITKSEQLAVIVLVVPETASQVAAKTPLK